MLRTLGHDCVLVVLVVVEEGSSCYDSVGDYNAGTQKLNHLLSVCIANQLVEAPK